MKTRFALLAIAFAILIPSAAALAQADTAGQMRRITNSYQEKLAAYREKTRSLPPDEQAKLSQAEYPDASGARS